MTSHIAIIGNERNSLHPIYTRIPESLQESAKYLNIDIQTNWFGTSSFVDSIDLLKKYDGIFAAPTPFSSLEGFYNSVKYARESNTPWISACGGTQYAIIEYARNVLGISDAEHVENDPHCTLKFVNYLPDCYRVSNDGDLKKFEITLIENSQSSHIYQSTKIKENFFANYMLDSKYYEKMYSTNLKLTGFYEESNTPCLIELEDHSFFIGALFQPQMSSSIEKPHPLITQFLRHS